MPFNIEGNLYSEVCKDCTTPLLYSKIRFYRADLDREVLGEIAANTKETLRLITAEQAKSMENALVGVAALDSKGHYVAKISEDTPGPLRIVAEIQGPDGKEARQGAAFVYLTTILPNWQYARDQKNARALWDYTIPQAFWCRLLEWFDLWVICGRITLCDLQNEGAGGVTVKVMDADVITDDHLGTTTTDASGHFKIYYHTLDFKKTFLSWMGINVETPFGGTLGPDVYFVVTAPDGAPLLTETRADGKKKGRKDVGRCACFNLCVKLPNIITNTPPIDPIWNKIGTEFPISTYLNPQAFDDEGYADAGGRKYAIYSTVALHGQVPDPTRSDCPLYRFKITKSTSGNAGPSLPAAAFAGPNVAIVGGSAGEFGSGLFVTDARLGTLYQYIASPFSYVSVGVFLKGDDVDDNGWADVVSAAQRALVDANFRRAALGLSAISTNIADYRWSNDGNQLMKIDTQALCLGEAPVGPVGLAVGDEFPSANRYSIPKVAIRFETKDRVTGLPRGGNGLTMNAMVLSNATAHATLALKKDNVFTGDCVSYKREDVGVAFSLYHPQLGIANLTCNSADGGFRAWPHGAPLQYFYPIADNTPHAGIVDGNASNVFVSPQPDRTCVYDVFLNYRLFRHNGISAEQTHFLRKSFYYEA